MHLFSSSIARSYSCISLNLFEGFTADFVSLAVNAESIGCADVIEYDFSAAGYCESQFPVAEGGFCKRTARRTVRFKDLQHIAALVIENGISSFAGFVNENVLAGAANKRIVAFAAPERIFAFATIEFIGS